MSDNRIKVAIRGQIPELDGKTHNDVIDVFRKALGEPSQIDEWEDNIEYFSYDDYEGLRSVYSDEDEVWGVEKIILDDYSYENNDACLSLEMIQETLKEMQKLFPSIKTVVVAAYTWYTGTDEPITFELSH